jgi:nicotinamide-nucleotide amidase
MQPRGVSIVAIGDEVLYGYTVNTNASYLASQLVKRGVFPVRHIVVPDAADDIEQAIRGELGAGHDVITIGGLGPTLDDLTRTVVSRLFNRPLVPSAVVVQDLLKRYGEAFPTISDQSMQPEGAVLFLNQVGTAPGIFLEDKKLFGDSRLFVLPGPPHELKNISAQIFPIYFPEPKEHVYELRFLSLAEHDIDPVLRQLQQQFPYVRLGIYPSYGLVGVHVSGDESLEVVEKLSTTFRRFLLHDSTLEAAVLRLLLKRGWTLATAESCTAGGLSARIASIPGASDALLGGVVTYSSQGKEEVLQVPRESIDRFGAVSTQVTEHMAAGAKALLHADVVCSVSGYFGPSGGTQTAPIGTVCATFSLPHKIVSQSLFFKGTRESICEKTIQTLLAKLVLLLQE